jgi:hypothetical protein
VPGNTENAVPEDRNPGTPDAVLPDAVLCEADGPVAVITINRPAAVEGYALWSSDSRNRGKEVEAQRF